MLFISQRYLVALSVLSLLLILLPGRVNAQLLTGHRSAEEYLYYDPDTAAQTNAQQYEAVTVYPMDGYTPAARDVPPPSPRLTSNAYTGTSLTREPSVDPYTSRPGPSYAQANIYRNQPVNRPAVPAMPSDEQPVDLVADNLQHNEQTGEITATGNVELVQGARILRADLVSYNLNTGTVTARGNISLTEPNGDVHFAEEVQLKDEMKSGFISGLQSYLSEGGRFRAEQGERISDKVITMRNASYTPCDCEEDEDGDPAWQIKAKEVTLDENEHRIKYKDAHVEIFGVPVLWTPFLAHPDGKVKRKSGFLSPGVGFD